MMFYKKNGKQILDMRHDLVLTRQSELIEANAKSCAPRRVVFARHVPNIGKLGFLGKLSASWSAIRFIWS